MRRNVAMRNKSINLFITVVAVIVIGIRVYRPEITVDSTTLTLLALAVIPWLSPLLKSFEAFGLRVEFRDIEPTPAREHIREGSREAIIADHDSELPSPIDFYLDRMWKLTPAEVVVAFILTNAMVTLTGSTAMVWASFLALVALTPLYLRFVGGVTGKGQLIASTTVFIAWVFALGGPFTSLDWYTPLLGALVLAIVTLIVPAFYVGEW
jgi:hypothetical protein